MATPNLSGSDRARLIKAMCARLVQFPRRDEVLAAMVRRWPSLFEGRAEEAAAAVAAEGPQAVPAQNDAGQQSLQQEVTQLRQALESNRDIGAATGIIMSRFRLTRDQAFDALRAVSQRQHRKLRDVADDVLMTGTLEGHPNLEGDASARRAPG